MKLILQHIRTDGLVLDQYESKTHKKFIDKPYHKTYYEISIKDRIIKIYDDGEIQDETGKKI